MITFNYKVTVHGIDREQKTYQEEFTVNISGDTVEEIEVLKNRLNRGLEKKYYSYMGSEFKQI